MIDRVGVDKVMWSTDYPHNEGTFGYTRSALKNIVDAVGPENGRKIVSDNLVHFLNL